METGAVYRISKKRQRSGGGEGSRQREIAWAAALVVGEGYVGIHKRRYRDVPYHYLTLSVSMLDEAAVRRFAAVFGLSVTGRPTAYDSNKTYWRATASGSDAERALRLLYPHMVGTVKARQTREAFAACDMTIDEDGSGRSKKRKNGWEGRAHSAATKEQMSAVRRAYWERRRGQ